LRREWWRLFQGWGCLGAILELIGGIADIFD
jgi:hypothetical protein